MKIKNLILLPMTLVATLILTGCDLLSLPIATEQCEEILQVLALNDEEERTATYHGITKDYSDLYEGSTGAKGQGEEVDGSYKRYDNDVRVNSETSVTWEFAEGNDARVNEEESTTETYTNSLHVYLPLYDYAKAADAYERALAIYEELAAANPQAYELDLCMTLLNLSLFYQTLYERDSRPTHKTEGLALAERAIVILQKYPNIPRAQQYLEFANDRKAFFEQAGE